MITRLVLISVPPYPLRSELELFRDELCAVGKSREALRYPVHVTLRTGVLLPEGDRVGFFSTFAEHVSTIEPFDITLGPFITDLLPETGGQGGGAHFAGYDIISSPGLTLAHEGLVAFSQYRKGNQYPFRPHLTMVFDDLDEGGLRAVKERASGRADAFVGRAWTCNAVECYRRLGELWVPDTALPLKGQTTEGIVPNRRAF